jgi:ABC-type transporter Mla maintaining outer membrane lipid asymmetry ATPase subunit MlaF
MVANDNEPRCDFCDEPSTGHDPVMAFVLFSYLWNLHFDCLGAVEIDCPIMGQEDSHGS